MIELFGEKEECCGCTACTSICPKCAILMKPDGEGFLYPSIDSNKCIECGLCKKVCAFQKEHEINDNFELPYVYAVKHKDEQIRMSSTSGGMFTAISDYILEKQGVVYGAIFDDNMRVCHQKAESNEEREKIKGAKYVQSNLKNTFKEVKEILLNDRYVLFSGTPCQVSGLKSYLNHVNTSKLYLCDIVCHGTPSPLIWDKYLSFIKNKYKGKVITYKFRDKNIGWRGANITVTLDNFKKDSNSNLVKIYSNLYFLDFISRKSCNNCKYTNLNRPSDITIADFWGIEKSMPDYDDNKGVSLVLINTPKGKDLFESINYNLEYNESNTIDCIQPQLQYPHKSSPYRDEFWKDYNMHGFEYVAKKHGKYNLKDKVKSKFVNSIRIILIRLNLLKAINNIRKRRK